MDHTPGQKKIDCCREVPVTGGWAVVLGQVALLAGLLIKEICNLHISLIKKPFL